MALEHISVGNWPDTIGKVKILFFSPKEIKFYENLISEAKIKPFKRSNFTKIGTQIKFP